MAGMIFYRERTKMKEGASQPHYMMLAVSGVDLKVYGHHMRMSELKFIAESVGAKLVAMPRGPKHGGGDAEEDDLEVRPE